MTTPDSTQTYHARVKKFFEKTAQEKARETKFVRRRSPIDGRLFLISMVLTVFQHGTIALDDLAKAARKINPLIEVCGQAFKRRLTAFAVDFLKACFAQALQLTAPTCAPIVPLLSSFSAVYLLDATTIALPDGLQKQFPGCGGAGPKASAKVFLLLNYLTGAYQTMRLTPGRKADQNMGQEFLPGRLPAALWMFDLGFFDAAFLASIALKKSFFLCRLAATQLNFWVPRANGSLESLDLDRLLRRARRELFEIKLVFGPKQEVSTRLILVPVPAKVSAERRRKAREKARQKGRTMSARTLRRYDWTLLLSNAVPEQLPTSTLVEVYRVRWQVELVFKLFKSDACLEKSLARESHRVQSELYAKLIAVLLFNQVCRLVEELAGEQISPVKLWRRMRGETQDWLCALGLGSVAALAQLLKSLERYARRRRGKKSPSTRQRLAEVAQQAQQQIEMANPLDYSRRKSQSTAQRKKTFARHLSKRQIALNPGGLSNLRAFLKSSW